MNIREFAEAMQLSVSTVSRALNGYADVNPETRARVVKAAEELGYKANPAARGLRTRESGFVAFVLSPPQKNFANPVLSRPDCGHRGAAAHDALQADGHFGKLLRR